MKHINYIISHKKKKNISKCYKIKKNKEEKQDDIENGFPAKCNCGRYVVHVNYPYFAEGTMRYAYKSRWCSAAPKPNQICVVKKWKENHVYHQEFWKGDIDAYNLAKDLVNKWNALKRISKEYQIVECQLSGPAEYHTRNVSSSEISKDEYCLIEDYLPGQFVKWNSNSGWFSEEDVSVHAFCHWTYHYSKGKILFCDAQGTKDSNYYYITDPCILSEIEGKYGATDCGDEYIQIWFQHHKCNEYCNKEWLKPGKTLITTAASSKHTTYVWQAKTKKLTAKLGTHQLSSLQI